MNNEKAYKIMAGGGAMAITAGIVAIVVGLATGILLLVSGGRLLRGKRFITF